MGAIETLNRTHKGLRDSTDIMGGVVVLWLVISDKLSKSFREEHQQMKLKPALNHQACG